MAEMTPHVYFVQLVTGTGDSARPFCLSFETALDSVEAVAVELARSGVVSGWKLLTVDDGRGGRMIRGREAIAFGAAGLVSIQNNRQPVWEPED